MKLQIKRRKNRRGGKKPKGGYMKTGKKQKGGGPLYLLPLNLMRNLGMLTSGLNYIMKPENKEAVMAGMSNVLDKISNKS